MSDTETLPLQCLLVMNAGSSSIKLVIYSQETEPRPLARATVTLIGQAHSKIKTSGERTGTRESEQDFPNHAAALNVLHEWINEELPGVEITAIGHRVVHGGPVYHQPTIVSEEVLQTLETFFPLARIHLPTQVEMVRLLMQHYPGIPQVLCFDTAFHHDMPTVAQRIALPREFYSLGIRRYGFHGISYSYLLEELARLDGPEAARGRVVFAHLGSGASMAAVKDGKPQDTTMGFTPMSGLVMSTRTGDIDPCLPQFLQQQTGMSLDEFTEIASHRSGILGVSETSADMYKLIQAYDDDERAREAVDLFCYTVRKTLGAYAAIMGGIDTLVFAGGIGENSAPIRARVCRDLEFLGIRVRSDGETDESGLLSLEDSTATVRVINSDEERMIATYVQQTLRT